MVEASTMVIVTPITPGTSTFPCVNGTICRFIDDNGSPIGTTMSRPQFFIDIVAGVGADRCGFRWRCVDYTGSGRDG